MPSRNPIRRALGRLSTWLWKRRDAVGPEAERDREGGDSSAARARFWTEFREGQREAEAHRSRPR
jgi:hypothetical protein